MADIADRHFWRPGVTTRDRMSEFEAFRGTARSLARDAMRVLSEVRLGDEVPGPTEERLHLLHHYLDYLIRLCDGEA